MSKGIERQIEGSSLRHWYCGTKLILPSSPKEARFAEGFKGLMISCLCPTCNISVLLNRSQFMQARKELKDSL